MMQHGKMILLGALILPGVALAQIDVGDELGASEAAIRSAMEAKGYVISEIEFEDDDIEVEATLDGTEYEIEVSLETGLVLEVELEDEEDE